MKSVVQIVGTVMLLWVVGTVQAASTGDSIKAARQLFDRYVSLEYAYDPAVADLYADDAVIRNTWTSAPGKREVTEIPATRYKALIVQYMPTAQERKDRSLYSRITYTPEGDGVRIKAKRFSVNKNYTSPLSILAKPSKTGDWQIVEELSESAP